MIFNIGGEEINFDEKTKNIVVNNRKIKPTIRFYENMKNIYNKKEDINNEEELYYMYRGVYLNKEDENIFKENKMRYDITIIIPKIIGKEFNKTFGHYHPFNKNGKKYEEIYEVLFGTAIFLQQNNENIKYTKAKSNKAVIMEESYGHVTINPSNDKVLIMANIVNDTFDSEYKEYKELKGANYYYTNLGFEKNINYKNDLTINESKKFFDGSNVYNQFLENPQKFNFLN